MPFGRRPNPVFSPAYAEVRAILTAARRRADAPQRRLAAQLGKAASHVSMIERGQRRVDVLEFYRIARALGADPVALFAALAERLASLDDAETTDVRTPEQAGRPRFRSRA